MGAPVGESRRYGPLHYALAIVLVVFVGVSTIVVEALAPQELPPVGLGWLAFAILVVLVTVTFVVTIIVVKFCEEIVASILRRSPRPSSERNDRLFRIAVFGLVPAAAAVAIWLLVDPGKLVKESPVGGLDLAGYCQSYKYTANSEELCSSEIPLNEACDWEYGAPGHRMEMTSGPLSGICYNSEGESVGGVDDMQGFCQARFDKSVNVQAAVVNEETWTCQTPIDKDLACSWRYQKGDLDVRKDQDRGLWTCYQ
jgi:uncharacterized membrane protein